MTILLIVLAYLACSFIGWGFTMGSFTYEFPMANNTWIAFFVALSGPIGMIVALVLGRFHWRLKPMTYQQRFAAFSEAFPSLASAEEYGENYFRKTW